MSLIKVPIYPTRNLAAEIDPGARSIVAGTNVSFVVNADGSITINASCGTGTVTSVGATGSTGLTVGGSPITTSGTLTFTLSANLQSWSGIAPSSKADTSALGSYVLKAGDTMTGNLNINTATNSRVVWNVSTGAVTATAGAVGSEGFIGTVSNHQFSFYTNNVARAGFTAAGQFNASYGIQVNNSNLVVSSGDIYAYRTGGTTGVIFLRSDGTRYLYYDSTDYVMPGACLVLNGGGVEATGTLNSNTYAVTGIAGTQGFQVLWNTAQAGLGRMEYINNRGGGSGGHTWWDRVSTGSGVGTALALLNSSGYYLSGLLQVSTASGGTVGQLGTHPTFGVDYIGLMSTAMTGQEYAVLFNRPAADPNTYISSCTGGTVNIRPSANNLAGQVIFSTTGVTMAQPLTIGGGKKISNVQVSSAAPGALADGTLYLRY